MHRLLQIDYGNFVRYGLTQITHGSIGDELAKQMVDRVPPSVARATWDMLADDDEDYGETIRALEVPLLREVRRVPERDRGGFRGRRRRVSRGTRGRLRKRPEREPRVQADRPAPPAGRAVTP